MRALKPYLILALLAGAAVTAATTGIPRKSVEAPDADLRLMAMLFVGMTTPR